jgi:hypothetical protein
MLGLRAGAFMLDLLQGTLGRTRKATIGAEPGNEAARYLSSASAPVRARAPRPLELRIAIAKRPNTACAHFPWAARRIGSSTMAPRGIWLVGLALSAGCADVESTMRPALIPDPVQFSAEEPGSTCRCLQRVEVSSRSGDSSSEETLRLYALRRAANYVLLEAFSVFEETGDDLVRVRARLYRCPQAARRGVPQNGYGQ